MLSRDDKDRFAKIIREQVCEPDGWGIYKAGTLQRCDRAVAELEAAGAFTPDQPAAPDEDAAVRELIHAFWIEGGTVRKDIAIAYAKRILAAGYRRPVDTRPTMTVSEYKWAHAKRWGTGNPVYADWLVEIGVLAPDPAPAAEVPVFASVEEAIAALGDIRWTLSPSENYPGQFRAATPDHPRGYGEYASVAATPLEALQALAAALTKATDR